MTDQTGPLTPDAEALELEKKLAKVIDGIKDDGTPEQLGMLAGFLVQLAIARAVRMRGLTTAHNLTSSLLHQPAACYTTHPLVRAKLSAEREQDKSELH